MGPPLRHGRTPGTMSTGVNAAVRAPAATARQHRLRRGRTRILALSDLTMLALAYTVSYLIADRIAPLPPVSGSAWFLALVAVTAPFVWLTVFTANKLYDNDSLKISVSSFDETRDLFHAMLVGSLGYLLLSQGVDHFFGWWVYTPVEAFIFLGVALLLIPVARGSIRSWVFPRVMTAAPDADRRHAATRRSSSTGRSRRTRSTGSRSSASSAPRASRTRDCPSR